MKVCTCMGSGVNY